MIDIGSFINTGTEKLAPYISGVSRFVEKNKNQTERSDFSLRSKPANVYIRNMLAVGVLSHLNKKAFDKTEGKVLVMPDCLKNYGDWECSKIDLGNESECAQCSADCLVFETVERFVDEKVDLVLEPEQLDKYLAERKSSQGSFGVVGVACVLTLLSGFEHTMKLKLPTQGIFLNYASCSHHWAEPGYNTSFSFSRLAKTLGKANNDHQPDVFNGHGQTYSLERLSLTPGSFYDILDKLAKAFETEYLPQFMNTHSDKNIFDIYIEILQAFVPDLITRDSA